MPATDQSKRPQKFENDEAPFTLSGGLGIRAPVSGTRMAREIYDKYSRTIATVYGVADSAPADVAEAIVNAMEADESDLKSENEILKHDLRGEKVRNGKLQKKLERMQSGKSDDQEGDDE